MALEILTPEEFTEDNKRSLALLKQLMISHGYMRNQHGFWVVPSAAARLQQIERDGEDEDGD
jgi:hypothetical protein